LISFLSFKESFLLYHMLGIDDGLVSTFLFFPLPNPFFDTNSTTNSAVRSLLWLRAQCLASPSVSRLARSGRSETSDDSLFRKARSENERPLVIRFSRFSLALASLHLRSLALREAGEATPSVTSERHLPFR
jgi:hypothetical protein